MIFVFDLPETDGNVCKRIGSPAGDGEYELYAGRAVLLSAKSSSGVLCELPGAFKDVGRSVQPLSAIEIDNLLMASAAGGDTDIEELQAQVMASVDAKTESLIIEGFTYSDVSVSLSDRDQQNILADVVMFRGMVADGIDVATINSNTDHFPRNIKRGESETGAPLFITVSTVEELVALHNASVQWIFDTREYGHTLQMAVANSSEPQLIAWVDPRA
jgi:hypothetical protein